MKWKNLEPSIQATSISQLVKNWSAIDIVSLIHTTNKQPFIILPDLIRQNILKHLKTKNIELGGLLVGNVISLDSLSEGIVAISITNAIESNDFDSTSVSLSMNSNVWQSANKLSDNETFVVGWYHSHPNLGAFFSSIDRKTQKDFFNAAYSLGLVIDPIRCEEAWFIGKDSNEVYSNYLKNKL